MARVTVRDLLRPLGEIDPQWIVGKSQEEIELEIAALLEATYTKVEARWPGEEETQNSAVTAYVYHKMFKNLWLWMVRQPTQVSFGDQGSKQISTTQMRTMFGLATHWWSQWVMFMPEEAEQVVPASQPTISVPATFSF